MTQKRCPYSVLEVLPSSAPFVIDAAYRAMLKRYHPDVNANPDAAQRTQELVEAYAIVGNAKRRAEYDAVRERASEGPQREKQRQSQKAGTASKAEAAPPPPPPTSHEGKSAAKRDSKGSGHGWMTALGLAIFLGISIFLASIGPNDSPSPQSTRDKYEMAADNLEAAASLRVQEAKKAMPASLREVEQTPLRFATLEWSAKNFVKILFKGGLAEARKFSEKCAGDADTILTWDAVDKCVAFDIAAAHLDKELSKELNAPVNSFFQFQSENAAALYESAGAPSFSFSNRLTQIRTAAEQAVEEAFTERLASERREAEKTVVGDLAVANSSSDNASLPDASFPTPSDPTANEDVQRN